MRCSIASTAGGTGGDPLLQRGDLGVAGPGLLFGRRHGAIVEPLEEPARGRVAGDDFLAGDQFAEIGNVVEPALDRAVLPVAAIAVRLEDGLGFGREGLGIVGRPPAFHAARSMSIAAKGKIRADIELASGSAEPLTI